MIKKEYLHDFHHETSKFYQINQLIQLKNAISTNYSGFFQSLTTKQVKSFWLLNDFSSVKSIHFQLRISNLTEFIFEPFDNGYPKSKYNLQQACQFPVERLIISMNDYGPSMDRIIINQIVFCLKKMRTIKKIEIRFPFTKNQNMYYYLIKKIVRSLVRLRILNGVAITYSTFSLSHIPHNLQRLLASKCLEARKITLGKTECSSINIPQNSLQYFLMEYISSPLKTSPTPRDQYFQGIVKLSLYSIIMSKDMPSLLTKGLQKLQALNTLKLSVDSKYYSEYTGGAPLVLPAKLAVYSIKIHDVIDNESWNKMLHFWLGGPHKLLQKLDLEIGHMGSSSFDNTENSIMRPECPVLVIQKLAYPNLKALQLKIDCSFDYQIDSLQHLQALKVLRLTLSLFKSVVKLNYECFLPSSIQTIWLQTNSDDVESSSSTSFLENIISLLRVNASNPNELREITLKKNFFDDKNWKYFNLPTLEELNLENCKISINALTKLLCSERLSSLTKLSLRNSMFIEENFSKDLFILIAECPVAKNLEELNLSGLGLSNDFTINSESPNFVGLHRLRFLSVSYNSDLQKSGLAEIFKLELRKLVELNINYIACSFNDIKDVFMSNPEILSSVKVLRMALKITKDNWKETVYFFNSCFKKLNPEDTDRAALSFEKKLKAVID